MVKVKVNETDGPKELLAKERQEESDTRQYVAAMIEARSPEGPYKIQGLLLQWDGSKPQPKPKAEFKLKSIRVDGCVQHQVRVDWARPRPSTSPAFEMRDPLQLDQTKHWDPGEIGDKLWC